MQVAKYFQNPLAENWTGPCSSQWVMRLRAMWTPGRRAGSEQKAQTRGDSMENEVLVDPERRKLQEQIAGVLPACAYAKL